MSRRNPFGANSTTSMTSMLHIFSVENNSPDHFHFLSNLSFLVRMRTIKANNNLTLTLTIARFWATGLCWRMGSAEKAPQTYARRCEYKISHSVYTRKEYFTYSCWSGRCAMAALNQSINEHVICCKMDVTHAFGAMVASMLSTSASDTTLGFGKAGGAEGGATLLHPDKVQYNAMHRKGSRHTPVPTPLVSTMASPDWR